MRFKDFDNRLFIIAKHRGPTSFDVVDAFRKATGHRKVGHAGTLDPAAEGVLLLLTGRGTRAVEHVMNLPKTYEFTVRLGVGTSTLDAEGDVVERAPCPDVSEGVLEDAAASFVGDYRLEPPAYSALKVGGRRSYEMARAGESPRVESRIVRIHEMELLDSDLPDVRLRIRCSRGTYVRSLARDFGAKFSVPAHLSRLLRSAIGPFHVRDGFPGERLEAGDTEGLEGIPLVKALDFLPGIVLSDSARRGLVDGALPGPADVVETIGSPAEGNAVRILDREGELLAVGSRRDEPERRRFSIVDSFRLLVDRRSVTG